MTPKGHATRAFILQTAAEVFAERGYADTTLAELIARSSLTKGAFYFHFASKDQLAYAVLEEKQRQWLELVREQILNRPTAIEQLRALGPALIKLHRDDPSAYSVSRLSRDLGRMPDLADNVRSLMNSWIELIAGIITQAQEQGGLPFMARPDRGRDDPRRRDRRTQRPVRHPRPPARAKRGFEQRMRSLIEIVDALVA